MSKYRKLAMAVISAVVFGIYSAITDDVISASEWAGIGTLALGAVFTYRAENTPAWNTAKTWVYALGAGSVLLQTVIVDGLDGREAIEIAILVAGTAGVYAVPNQDVFRSTGQAKAG